MAIQPPKIVMEVHSRAPLSMHANVLTAISIYKSKSPSPRTTSITDKCAGPNLVCATLIAIYNDSTNFSGVSLISVRGFFKVPEDLKFTDKKSKKRNEFQFTHETKFVNPKHAMIPRRLVPRK
jgi:hypothetical protein